MAPDFEKMIEVFIGGLPQSIEGNVTASRPQTLEESINIAQRLMDQVIKHTPVQVSSDHKQKFEDRRNTTDNNNYPNDRNNNNHSNNHNNDSYQNNHNNHNRNNDYHQQQNRRQETIRTYAATPTENKRSMIGSLMYLTSSRPDIMFAVCVCARYQVNPRVSHLHAVKRIFSYLKINIMAVQETDSGCKPQQKLSMWLLQVAVEKCFGFRINYLIMARHNLLLLLKVNDARHKLPTAGER
ncbi:hypothetical protein Tco_0071950 [Tanacetum coccineum]